MQRKTEKRAYDGHKRTAALRGIRFCFTFPEWRKWWRTKLGPDWLEKRGRKRGQYVMARKGDIGPYHLNNVYCEFANVNCAMKGSHNGCSKLNEQQVTKIFLMEGSIESIAKRYEISFHTVWDIRSGRYWGHITKGLGLSPMRKSAKLTKEQVLEIYGSKTSALELASKFQISRNTIYSIRAGLIWKKFTQ